MTKKMDKQLSKRDEVRLNFVHVLDAREKLDVFRDTINLYRHEPLSSLIDKVSKGCNIGGNIAARLSFMYDEMLVEGNATPMGLGMDDDDTLVVVLRRDIIDPTPNLTTITGWTKRKAKEILGGLNVLAEAGLPLVNLPAMKKTKTCREQMANLRTAIKMTMDKVADSGMAPDHRPDFRKVKKKYLHAHQGFQEVEDIMQRYQQGTMVLSNTEYNTQEAIRRELLYNKIAGTIAEFREVPDSNVEECNAVYYVGPTRNSTALNYLSCAPTVQLRGVHNDTPLNELVKAWNTYVKDDINSNAYLGAVSYDNVKYTMTESESYKVGSVVCEGLNKHYFCLDIDPGQQYEDNRDIDQLLEFIEGDDRKEQDKRKKKQRSEEVVGLEVKAKALEADADIAEAEALETEVEGANALEAEGEKALEAEAEGAKALEAEAEGAKALEAEANRGKALEAEGEDVKYVCQDGPESDIVGGCKKKVKSKERTENEELDNCIAEKEAMLEERRCYAESIIESKSKEMRKLITGFEEAEDFKAIKIKEVSDIDVRVGELQALRAQLLTECEAKDEVMSKLLKKRKKLEEFITSQIKKYKSETSQLEEELKNLKLKQSKSNENKVSNELMTVKTPNLQLCDYIDRKIEIKEKELECPVCLEVALVPIFMCDELHLICSSCRPKVSECPECRQSYLGRPRRHRYAEKIAEELEGLWAERGEILGD